MYSRKIALLTDLVHELTARITVGIVNSSRAELLGKAKLHKLLVKLCMGMGASGQSWSCPCAGLS